MSFVSGVTLITSVAEDVEALKVANEWLDGRGTKARFTEVADKHYGGNKHPQIEVIGSGLNYFDEDGFAAFIGALPWSSPENVVLVIQPEEGRTRIWRFAPEWTQV